MELFDDTFLPLGIGEAWFATRGCPDCLDHPLERVHTLDEAHWLCATCGTCWRVEHGLLRSVDPLTCRGCGSRNKSECIGTWRGALPGFDDGTTAAG